MKVFDVEELVKDIHTRIKGQRGTILEIYDDRYCQVEIRNDHGRTIYQVTQPLKDLNVILQSK